MDTTGMNARKLWLDAMIKVAEPVLTALAERRLERDLPTEFNPPKHHVRCLEAFGRTMCGIAPWLELEDVEGEEAELQDRFRRLAREAIDSATDPASEDFLNFTEGGQPLVDAAFLAHGIVRAPVELYHKLDDRVKANLAAALRSSRVITPCESNWLFFAAMVEAALHIMGEEVVMDRVDHAVERFTDEWYIGDGTYSDGQWYHFDYYNSFVIHPMFIDVLRTFEKYADFLPVEIQRATRYAHILEGLINCDGTYPVIGRSVSYRFASFQLLSQAALQGFLPEDITPSQVRCALTAVIGKCLEGGMFDGDGWVVPGVYGYQPGLAEDYISNGSPYLCSAVFLALGLSAKSEFWSGADEMWTSQKLWSGVNLRKDRAKD